MFPGWGPTPAVSEAGLDCHKINKNKHTNRLECPVNLLVAVFTEQGDVLFYKAYPVNKRPLSSQTSVKIRKRFKGQSFGPTNRPSSRPGGL